MRPSTRFSLVILAAIVLFVTGSAFSLACAGVGGVPRKLYYVDAYWLNITRAQGLASDYVTAVAVDKNGQVYAGTRDGGLSIVDLRLHVTTMGKKDGLPSDQITAVAVSPADEVWVGTNKGIAVLSDGKIKESISAEEGLPDNLVTDIEFRGLEPWIATPKGLAVKKTEGWRVFRLNEDIPTDKMLSVCPTRKGEVWAVF